MGCVLHPVDLLAANAANATVLQNTYHVIGCRVCYLQPLLKGLSCQVSSCQRAERPHITAGKSSTVPGQMEKRYDPKDRTLKFVKSKDEITGKSKCYYRRYFEVLNQLLDLLLDLNRDLYFLTGINRFIDDT